MLNLGDLYKVAEAMVPLYVWLGFGYACVRWWRIISQQCKAIERLVFFIILPLFTFHLTAHTDPFAMNYRMIGADAISKVLVAALLMAWLRCSRRLGHRDQERPGYCWAITSFSLTQLTNSLVVGVPLVTAMYGPWAGEVVVQLSVVQAIVWLPLLQFVFELRKAGCSLFSPAAEAQVAPSIEAPPPPPSSEVVGGAGEGTELAAARSSSCSPFSLAVEAQVASSFEAPPPPPSREVVGGASEGTELGAARSSSCSLFSLAAEAQVALSIEAPPSKEVVGGAGEGAELSAARSSSCSLIKAVLLKLAKNPNSYAGIIGMTWALLANRIIEDSIQPMSAAGRWMSIFSMGLFMASQDKILACGPRLTAYAMVLKFVGGPAAMAIGAFLVGLHGEVLNLAIMQAAVPQSITSFMFAQEYELDVDVLSTAITFGMLVCLPVLVIYSTILEFF